MRLRAPAGQTATEYMLVISVIVCSLVAAAYLFIPEFQGGVAELANDVSVALATGQVGGIGFNRGGGGGGGGGGSSPQTPIAGTHAMGRSSPVVAAPSQNIVGTGNASALGQPVSSQSSGVPTLTNIGHNPNAPNQPTLNNTVYHPGGPNQPTLNNGVYHPPPPSGPTLIST